MKKDKHIVRNIVYLLLLAVFLIGGVFSFLNCAGNNLSDNSTANSQAQTTVQGDENKTTETPATSTSEEITTAAETTEAPAPPDEILPYNKLQIDSNSLVGIVRSDKANATDLTFDDIKALVIEAVKLAGGLESIVKDGDTVVLKPNLVNKIDCTLPGWTGRKLSTEVNGVCTDWRVTKAVAQLVRELDPSGKIYIMEGSAIDTQEAFNALNYTKEYIPEVDEILPIETDSGAWGDKNSDGLVKVSYKDGLLYKEYYLNKKIYEADVLICLPTLKNHWDAVVTGGIKNIAIGTTPANIYGISKDNTGRDDMVDHRKPEYHKWMADFYTCRPADFVITDGLQGIQNGPDPCYDQAGVSDIKQAQKNMRVIMASKDALAIDITQTNIINWDIESVKYLQYLIEAGNVGNGNTKNITVLGNVKVDDIRSDFAGITPATGGRTLRDKTPPDLSIESAWFEGDNLRFKLNTSDDTDKIDIYIDGVYNISIPSPPKEFGCGAPALKKGTHDITIYSYDKYMNHSEATVKADKQIDSGVLGQFDYAAPFAASAPVIDGKGDDLAWVKADWKPIDQLWLGDMPSSDDFSGRYKMVWTEDRLYYLVEITDDYISTTRKDTPLNEVYNDDCLELFIDENASGGDHEKNYNAFAYHMSFWGKNIVDINEKGEAQNFNDNLEYAIGNDAGSNKYVWEVEMKIFDDTFNANNPVQNTPVKLSDGKVMGFGVAYCDADQTNTREHFMGSMFIPGDDKNIAWKDASVFAKLYLVK